MLARVALGAVASGARTLRVRKQGEERRMATFVAGADTPNVGLAASGVNAIRVDTENA
jgi:hypothetical protein